MIQTTPIRPVPTSKPIARKKPKTLTRTIVNFWLDVLLGVLFLAVLWVAAVVRLAFPAGTVADGWQLWGLSYSQWSDLLFVLICTLGTAVLVHVMLHWTWVCGVVASNYLPRRDGRKPNLDDGTRTILGVGLLIVLLCVLGIPLWLAIYTTRPPF